MPGLRTRQTEEEEAVADPVAIEAMLRASLREWQLRPSGDGRVNEETAAMLIGYSAGTLRNMRMAGTAPRSFRLNSKIGYRLSDLAQWLSERLEQF